MILVRKNVYEDVCLFFENVFNVYKMFGNVCVFVFENRKDGCLKWSK